jgi:F-type H+-transporting ATPase subunit epsilon
MRLHIFTPLAIAVDENDVQAVRAEDDTGSFGILPGHADFLTSLGLSLVSWTGADGASRYCAVRRGVLRVEAGREVSIATREAVTGLDLETLHREVTARLEQERESERHERVESTRIHLSAIRYIMRHLQPGAAERP